MKFDCASSAAPTRSLNTLRVSRVRFISIVGSVSAFCFGDWFLLAGSVEICSGWKYWNAAGSLLTRNHDYNLYFKYQYQDSGIRVRLSGPCTTGIFRIWSGFGTVGNWDFRSGWSFSEPPKHPKINQKVKHTSGMSSSINSDRWEVPVRISRQSEQILNSHIWWFVGDFFGFFRFFLKFLNII